MAVSQSCVIWAQYFPRGLPHPCHPYPEPDLAALLAAIPIKAVPDDYSSLKSVLIFPRLRTSIANSFLRNMLSIVKKTPKSIF